MSAFEALGLSAPLLQAISDLGFETPSEVQEKTIPLLLEKEIDLVSLAQTGTGKTAAFGFPLLQKIDPESRTTQGLILSPTRELCMQLTNELKAYSKYMPKVNTVAIYGGASIQDQARSIKKGAQIIVATPGRMKDMIGRRMIDISKIEYCILDEADEMLNMGFYEDIQEILSHTPEDKSTWLFSATMPKEVSAIAKKFMHTPVEITIGTKNTGATMVSHEFYTVNARDRYAALKRLADAHPSIFSVVFCRTKRDTQKVAEKLIEDGYNAGALHGDLSQNQRDIVMKSFRSRQIQMLVATDVAARGIDVEDITHVINYQLPDEIETYTHRSGRTGRAGKTGVSMVLVSKSEFRKIKAIEKIIQKQFTQKEIPNGMEICEIQLFHLANNIQKTEVNAEIDPYLPGIMEAFKDLDKETLIKKVFSVEFARFFNYYKNSKDLNLGGSPSQMPDGDSVRYFVNIGEKDDFNWMTLKDFLRDSLELDKDDVYKVDVKGSFSFFNTDAKHSQKVLDLFQDFTLEGRKITVEVSKEGRRGGGRNRGRDGGGRSRDGGYGRDKKDYGSSSFKGHRGKRKSGGDEGGGKSYGKSEGSGKSYGKSEGSDKSYRKSDGGDSPFKGKSRRKSSPPSGSGTGGKRRRR